MEDCPNGTTREPGPKCHKQIHTSNVCRQQSFIHMYKYPCVFHHYKSCVAYRREHGLMTIQQQQLQHPHTQRFISKHIISIRVTCYCFDRFRIQAHDSDDGGKNHHETYKNGRLSCNIYDIVEYASVTKCISSIYIVDSNNIFPIPKFVAMIPSKHWFISKQ